MLDQLDRVRFLGDVQGRDNLRSDEDIAEWIQHYADDRNSHSARKRLLGNAVRVDEEVLPDLGKAISDIHRRIGIQEEVECFVYENPSIDACVFRGRDHLFVLLSSAAIEKLNAEELEFVIGHEIGHVIYDHFEIPVGAILQSEQSLQPKHAIRLLSWQRQAEISADRAGLICCGSLEVAASAFFKTLSGLSIPNLRVNPIRFAAQFDHLKDEIFREGAEDMWTFTHPLSPLRMKSMNIFWESEVAKALVPTAPGGRTRDACEKEIDNLLAYMDPRGSRGGDSGVDPVLEPFILWGGMIIAGSDNQIDRSELETLSEMVGQHNVAAALKEPKSLKHYFQRFKECQEKRQQPLSALDLNRIFTCLIAVVRADGKIAQGEISALHKLAKTLGVATAYIDGLLEEF